MSIATSFPFGKTVCAQAEGTPRYEPGTSDLQLTFLTTELCTHAQKVQKVRKVTLLVTDSALNMEPAQLYHTPTVLAAQHSLIHRKRIAQLRDQFYLNYTRESPHLFCVFCRLAHEHQSIFPFGKVV